MRSRKVVCAEKETKEHLPEEKCRADEKPTSSSSCIERSCADSQNNEDNSIAVDHIGRREDNDQTQKQTTNNAHQQNKFSDANRRRAFGKGSRLPRYRWKVGHWSKCSELCGGRQTRLVTCYDRVRGQIEHEQGRCGRVRPRPRDEQTCSSSNCSEGKWVQGEWSECSTTCGKVRILNPMIRRT